MHGGTHSLGHSGDGACVCIWFEMDNRLLVLERARQIDVARSDRDTSRRRCARSGRCAFTTHCARRARKSLFDYN